MKKFILPILAFMLVKSVCIAQEPTTQVSDFSITDATANSISLSWTRGNGDSVIIVAREGGLTAGPSDGIGYTADANYGDGDAIEYTTGFPPTTTYNYVVYKGTGTSATVTGLTSAKECNFYAFEFNYNSGSEDYLISYTGNNGNQTTAPSSQSQTILFSSVATTSMTASWTNGNGEGRIVALKEGTQGTITNPSFGTEYSASSDWSAKGDQLGSSEYYIVYQGNGSNVNLSNLAVGTNYWMQIFEYEIGSTDTAYNTSTASGNPNSETTIKNAPTSQASIVSFSSVETSAMTVNWSRGDGDYCLVVAEANGEVNNPADGSDYTPNTAFGSGSAISGSGTSYVVYEGTGTTVDVTNLSPGTTYTFKVFEFNNTSSNTKYLLSDGTDNPDSQSTLFGEPSTQASLITFSSVQTTSMTINWTSGDGTNRIVAVRETDQGTITNPSDNSTYTASNDWSVKGTQLGTSGYYTVYNGNSNSVSLTNLSAGTTYWVQIFEYNNGAGSEDYLVSTETGNPNSQATIKNAPTSQASIVSFESVASTSMTVNWSRGDGDRCLVVAEAAGEVNNPADGSDYIPNAAFGSGSSISGSGTSYVVYEGTGTTVDITGLTAGTSYTFKVFEFNNTGTNTKYLLSDGTDNPDTQATLSGEPTTQASLITFPARGTTTMSISWTNGNGANRIVAVRETDQGSIENPSDNSTYTASTDWSAKGTQLGTSGYYTVYNGSSNSVSLTNLSEGTTYWVQIFEYNNGAGSENYLTSTASGNPNSQATIKSAPTSQATAVGFASVATTSMTVNWTRGDGDYCVVVAEAAGDANSPSDGNDYIANAAFGSGSSISGTGTSYVVYEGIGTTVDITGLTAGTSYTFKVFEFNNTGTNTKYLLSDGTDNPDTQATLGEEPTTQASLITFPAKGTTTMTISWTNGNGSNRIVAVRETDQGTITNPSDNSTYTASNDWSAKGTQLGTSGYYTVFNGSSNSVSLTNLNEGTTYWVQVFEYNNGAGSEDYLVSTASGNPNSSATIKSAPTSQASIVSFASVETTAMTVNWSRGNGDYCIVVAEAAGDINSPADGNDYIANATFGSGSSISGTGTSYVVYEGTGTTVDVTNLAPSTSYTFKVFEFNNTGTNTKYLLSDGTDNPDTQSTLTGEPTTQASLITFPSTGPTTLTISWTNGNGANRIVAVRETDQGTIENPSDNSTYTASTDWSAKGTQLGSSGYYTVYNGSSNSVALTNLNEETTYWVQVFEYNNGAGSEDYLTSTSTGNPNSTSTLKAAPTTQTTNVSVNDSTSSSMSMTFTAGSGEYRIVVASNSRNFTNNPSNGTEYTANAVYGSGDQISGSGYVVYSGTGTSVTVTGLNSSTEYFFKAFEFNNTGTNTRYCTLTGTNNPDSSTTYGAATWYGTTADWGTASNWSPSGVPTSNQDVTIPTTPTGGTMPSVSSGTHAVNNITIEAGATLSISDGATLNVSGNATLKSPSGSGMPGTLVITGTGAFNVTGTSTIERYIPTSNSHFFTSPITSPSVADFAGYYVGKYDEPNSQWNYFNLDSTMNAIQGYEVLNGGAASSLLSFSGTFNNGNMGTISLTKDGTGLDGDTGWNLVGNPYPSTVDYEASGWTRTNVDATIYIYDASLQEYSSYQQGSQGNFYLAPMQAFFVHISDPQTSGSFGMSNSVRVTNQISFKSTPEVYPMIEVMLSSNGNSRTTLFSFRDGATSSFDPQYDSYKLLGYNDTIPDLYSIANGSAYIERNSLPADTLNKISTNGIIYDLGIKNVNVDTLEFSISQMVDIPDDINIYVIDQLEKIKVNLKEQSYKFANLNISDSRFQLQLLPAKTLIQEILLSSDAPGDSISINETAQMFANTLPSNVTNSTITWSVDNESIASIDPNNGLLSGLSEGLVTVTAEANDGSNAFNTIQMKVYTESIDVDSIVITHQGSSDSIYTNSVLQFNAEVYPVNASNKTFTWSVSDTTLASINSSTGLLTALKTGTINVTATSNFDASIKASYSISIIKPLILVESISITVPNDSVAVNSTLELSANILPVNASNQSFNWSVDSSAIATIDPLTGVLTAKSEGNVIVSAAANDGSGVTASVTITVFTPNIAVNSIEIIAADSIEVNKTLQVSANVLPLNATNTTIAWSIDNTEIASINNNTAILSAKKEGIVTITALANDGSLVTASKQVKIYQPVVLVDSININSDKDSININETMLLTAEVFPINASDQTLHWSIDNTDIATINESTGLLSAKKEGVVKISAIANDKSKAIASKLITIESTIVLVDSIIIINESDSVEINSLVQFDAIVYPTNSTNQTFTWSVSNSDIASIDKNTGLFTAFSEGEVEVFATANDESLVVSSFMVTIYKNFVLVETINIESEIEADSLLINTSAQLSAEVLPENAAIKTVDWSVDNNEIASIDQTGRLTGKKLGIIKVIATAKDNSGSKSEKTIVIYNTITDIKNSDNFELVKFYPNPASEYITLIGGNGEYKFKIYNNVGKLIISDTFTKQKEVSISGMEPGAYFIEFISDKQKQIEILIVN